MINRDYPFSMAPFAQQTNDGIDEITQLFSQISLKDNYKNITFALGRRVRALVTQAGWSLNPKTIDELKKISKEAKELGLSNNDAWLCEQQEVLCAIGSVFYQIIGFDYSLSTPLEFIKLGDSALEILDDYTSLFPHFPLCCEWSKHAFYSTVLKTVFGQVGCKYEDIVPLVAFADKIPSSLQSKVFGSLERYFKTCKEESLDKQKFEHFYFYEKLESWVASKKESTVSLPYKDHLG